MYQDHRQLHFNLISFQSKLNVNVLADLHLEYFLQTSEWCIQC